MEEIKDQMAVPLVLLKQQFENRKKKKKNEGQCGI